MRLSKLALWPNLSQFSSVAQLCLTLCNPTDCSTTGFPVQHQLLEPIQTHVHCVMWCHPTISSSVIPFSSRLLSFPASGSFPMSQFFVSDGQSAGVSASASVLPTNYSGLISFRIDWLDLLAVQGTLKSLLQLKSINSLVLSLPYGPTLTSILD